MALTIVRRAAARSRSPGPTCRPRSTSPAPRALGRLGPAAWSSPSSAPSRRLRPPVAGHPLAGVAFGTVFLRRQGRLANPLLDLGLLRTRPRVRRTLAALFLTALLMGGTSLFFNLYLQEVQGLYPARRRLVDAAEMVSMIAAANLGPWLNRRLPSAPSWCR